MTEQEKIISEANKYVMPAVDDYLGARCLLLNNIFVGLTLAHEAVEKLMKALLVLEGAAPGKSHSLAKLAELLIQKDSRKYKFLNGQREFTRRLDQHYSWRYYDSDITKRSQSRSAEDLYLFDVLWIALHKLYMDFLPEDVRFRTIFLCYLLDEKLKGYTDWGKILQADNQAIENDIASWKTKYKKIFDVHGDD